MLHVSLNIVYWSLSTKKMSDLVTWVATKVDFFLSLVTVDVIPSRRRKPAQATLKAVSMFKSSSELTGLIVIFSRIFFMINKHVY